MARNASGTYTLPAGNPVVSGTLIDATWANNTLADLGNEMTDSLSRSGEGAMLAPLRITDGVQATPSLAFSNEPSSGLYRAGSNEWWAVAAGVQNLRFTNLGLTTRAAAGAVGTPSIAAFGDPDTGIYFPGANELAIATGGAARMTFDAAGGVAVPGTFSLSAGTANGVLYLNASKVATSGSALQFSGTGLGIRRAASSGYVLDIDTSAGDVARIIGSDQANVRLRFDNGGAGGRSYEFVGGYPGANNSSFSLFDATASTIPFSVEAATPNNTLLLNASGNVGIGTASPGQKLEVAGNQRFTGSQVGTKIENRNTAVSVSTATTILDESGAVGRFVVVNGESGGDRFCDLVLCSTAASPTVVSSFTAFGSPAARTYTRSGSALQLAMASGTYNVNALALGY